MKFFIYDQSRAFARFMKLQYPQHKINICNSDLNKSDISYFPYDVAFVIVEKHENLLDLMRIQNKVKYVFAHSSIKEIKNALNEMDGIITMDLNKIKKEFLRDVNSNLTVIESRIIASSIEQS